MLFLRDPYNYELLRTGMHVRGNGWKLVSPEIEDKLLDLLPFVLLTVENDVIVDVQEDTEAKLNPPDQPIPSVEPSLEEYLVDLDFRMSLIELGVN